MDMDSVLIRLREIPVDPRLPAIEEVVLTAMIDGRDPEPPLSRGLVGVAACMALVLGVLASAIPGGGATLAAASPVATVPALAPSSLLEGHG